MDQANNEVNGIIEVKMMKAHADHPTGKKRILEAAM